MKVTFVAFLCLFYANLTQSQHLRISLSNRDFLPWISEKRSGAIYNDMVNIIEKKLNITITYKREASRYFVASVREIELFQLKFM